tara:strand:- start:5541 stop:6185 length:645 start_codon:yes stop_codon:yes gene_type:complete
MDCKYCKKKCKNNNSLTQHEIRCEYNVNKIKTSRSEETKQKIKNTIKERGIYNKVTWTDEMKLLAGEKSKINNKKYWTDETRLLQSKKMKEVVIENPDSYSSSNVSGRVKTYDYNGFKLKGKWELLVAKSLDDNSINWTNKIDPIPYMWEGKWHLYFPDFYLKEFNLLIEVKGYKRERDVQKWLYVKSPFLVLSLTEINEIKKNSINILKYINK